MKKLILMLSFMMIGFFGFSQGYFSQITTDTLTNTTAATYTFNQKFTTGQIGVYVEVTQLTGTSAGVIYYQTSADGTNFYTMATDTISGSGTHLLESRLYGKYFRVYVVPSGTHTTKLTGCLNFKRDR